MRKKLNQYSGMLNPKEIAEGISVAQSNAKRLLEDAKILLSEKRYSSATALAILSIEESGKTSILRGLALVKSDKAAKAAWKQYRSHTAKNLLWAAPQLVFERKANKLEDFKELFSSNCEYPDLLENIKQISLYTDCLGSKNWSCPDNVINAGTAEHIVFLAGIFAEMRDVTNKEIELWIKHMKPVTENNLSWNIKALENWYEEMQSENLLPSGENKMKYFIRKGLDTPKKKGV